MIQLGGPSDDDDWETDPDYVNELTEEERRFGGRRNCEAVDMKEICKTVVSAEAEAGKAKAVRINGSMGYGGKFGVEKDRMDACAMGHDYEGKVEKHGSQTDYAKGFGGKHGVMKDRQDESALGWDHVETLEKHESQKDYKVGFGGQFGIQKDRVDKSAKDWSHVENLNKHQSQTDYKGGFGGKFGVQTDRVDKSAVGWEHVETVEKHQSQKDYKTGFGGQFGVQKDRVDKSAHGWEHMENLNKHESQTDYSKGFGGKYGIQSDRVDKNAHSFDDAPGVIGTNYTKDRPEIPSRKNIRDMFEKGGNAGDSGEEFKRQKEQRKEQEAREVMAENRRLQEKKNKEGDEEGSSKNDMNGGASEVQRLTSKGQALSVKQRFESKGGYQSNGGSNAFAEERRKELEQIKQMKSENQSSESSIQDVRSKLEETAPSKAFIPAKKVVEPVVAAVPKASPVETVAVVKEEEKPIEFQPPAIVKAEKNVAPKEDCFKAQVAQLDNSSKDEEEETAGSSSLSAIARYDYQAGADDEISFLPDDIIINIEKVDEGWWLGECHGKYGLFPANYVEII